MSNVPADLHYTKDHEWIRLAADGTATIGITDHAQAALGDVTFVDLPKAGKAFGAFSTSTRHIRQLAAIDSFL